MHRDGRRRSTRFEGIFGANAASFARPAHRPHQRFGSGGLGRGLDVALEHRGAEWRDGVWVPAPELWDEDDRREWFVVAPQAVTSTSSYR